MTFGVIDTGTSQWNLDFAVPFSEGFRDCYVKMGGDNVDTYVAPWYTTQVDRARVAGFRHVGHYWVPDANPNDPDLIDTPTQQADWMIDRLHDWRRASDFIVLDNENLDGAVRFNDSQAAEFVNRVKSRRGIPGEQIDFYTNLSDARAHEWPLLLATGVNFIIAAPSYAPFAFPDIPTIPRSRIVGHQHGARFFGGVETDVNTFTDDAFNYGGAGMSLEAKAREFAAKYPTPASHPSGGDGSWDQDCGRVMFRFGSFLGWRTTPIGDISSAYRAYRNSHIESRVPAGAPVGACHWWDIGGEANGHVAQQVDSNSLIFMGSAKVWEDLGVDIGFASVDDYNSKTPGAVYLGWSRDYSGGTVNLSATAGGGYTPIEEDDMFSDADRSQLANVWAMLITGATYNGQTWKYGVLPIVAHNQTLISQQSGRIAALESAVSQLVTTGGGTIDLAAVQEAARAGAATALDGLGFPTLEAIADAVNDDAADRLTE